VENAQWQALWDANNLYIIFETNYSSSGTGATSFNGTEYSSDDAGASFTTDDLEIFFDPNRDGETNTAGDTNDDSYQFTVSLVPGTASRAGGAPGPPFWYAMARANALFGDTGLWTPTQIAFARNVVNGTGATVEIQIPFAQVNNTADAGLTLTGPPQNGDTWFINVGRTAGNGALPIWNYHAGDANPTTGAGAFFAERPLGEITFQAAPSTGAKHWALFE
jgi:hypothetical protein